MIAVKRKIFSTLRGNKVLRFQVFSFKMNQISLSFDHQTIDQSLAQLKNKTENGLNFFSFYFHFSLSVKTPSSKNIK